MSLLEDIHTPAPSEGSHSLSKPAKDKTPASTGSHTAGSRKLRIQLGLIAALVVVVLAGVAGFATASSPEEMVEDAMPVSSFSEEVNAKVVPDPASTVDRSKLLTSNKFYLAQSRSGTCTLTSAAMMLRRALYLQGDKKWKRVTESSLAEYAWTNGLACKFDYEGFTVSEKTLSGGLEEKKSKLIQLLKDHPEGIVVYDSNLPHAFLLTDYDKSSGVFYGADPAPNYSGKRMPIANTWNGHNRGSQDQVLSFITNYWSID